MRDFQSSWKHFESSGHMINDLKSYIKDKTHLSFSEFKSVESTESIEFVEYYI